MRKSLQDIAFMLRAIPYPRPLPAEISHLHYYIIDSGHSIMCVPECLLEESKASGEIDMYEAPVPVKYVLEKGWRKIPGTDCISVDVPYDDTFGVDAPDEYSEYEDT